VLIREITQYQWIIIGVGTGALLVLIFVLSYTAMWKPREEEKIAADVPIKDLKSFYLWLQADFPWILILTIAGFAIFSVLYPILRHLTGEMMKERESYIEFKILSPFWGWVLIIFITVSLLAFGMWAHMIIPDRPREWNYGAMPDTPAQSAYSTLLPSRAKAERVVPALPEAKPLKPFAPYADWDEGTVQRFLQNKDTN
jgi:hypothetical protein